MSLNRKHKNQLEKCVGELPVEQWQELAKVLKMFFKEVQERASKDTRVFDGNSENSVSSDTKDESHFKACIIILQAIEMTLMLPKPKKNPRVCKDSRILKVLDLFYISIY